MPTLEGSVESIVFHNEETHYTVARFRPSRGTGRGPSRSSRDGLLTIVGILPGVRAGEVLTVEGIWEYDPRYGHQLHVTSFSQRLPTSTEGIIRYLSSGLIKGIGPKKARTLVEHFGEQTLAIIEQQPERLAEVRGLSQKDRERIVAAWTQQQEMKEVQLFLQTHDIALHLANRIYRQYGAESVKVVRENPYRLVQDVYGIGFRTADQIATRLGLPRDSLPRLVTGLTYVLAQAANEAGHCYLPEDELLIEAARILEAPRSALEQALEQGLQEGELFLEPALASEARYSQGEAFLSPTSVCSLPHGALAKATTTPAQPELNMAPDQAATALSSAVGGAQRRVYYGPFWHAERGSARLLRRLLRTPSRLPAVSPALWEQVFHHLEVKRQLQLTPRQREAVQTAFTSKVSILTGGPGTGKTTSLRALLLLLRRLGVEVALTAPTGRAAKRLSEATGLPAQTLHRLLEYTPHDGAYQRHEERPLSCQFVIVDECSMVDILLFYHLLKALPPEAHLLLVGDADQLPSVGPGNVLRDLLRSEVIPTTHLTELFRQARQSRIVVSAHRVNAGLLPVVKNEEGSDFLFLRENDPLRARNLILDLVEQRLPARYHLNPRADIQVLSPIYRGPLGVISLNELLQQRLNPRSEGELLLGKHHLRIGDKVMQVRNDYDKGVFNGDLGWIRRIDHQAATVTVEFQEEAGPLLVEYEFAELDALMLAYAVTIHKSQGSEYPAVIIPLFSQHSPLLQRNLLYTAITRARRLCVLVGQPQALEQAIRNDRVAQRNTALAERLQAFLE
ncbi:ATP-dependent RecD-like DNA helicase [Thermogemmatispora sp.]|uniref:SF1B family DNA helicase RecD2 n=1 Tax=Thermogemmatispora sp. TaxID=1968838 RepID=UPI001D644458|nr:ATP-dependent RecD-like DNA helicase [Thermogemmatispora sp.]MBX5448883.1 ATP-dependent RecD-like DNA helicase [Thermogemmatispora sp.]